MTYASTGTTLLPLAAYTDLFNVTDVVNFFNVTMTEIGPVNIFMIVYFVTAVIQYSGIILTLWFIYKDFFKDKRDRMNIDPASDERSDNGI